MSNLDHNLIIVVMINEIFIFHQILIIKSRHLRGPALNAQYWTVPTTFLLKRPLYKLQLRIIRQ